jgi:hypothetical protein
MNEEQIETIMKSVNLLPNKEEIIIQLCKEIIRLQDSIKVITNKHPLDGGWN